MSESDQMTEMDVINKIEEGEINIAKTEPDDTNDSVVMAEEIVPYTRTCCESCWDNYDAQEERREEECTKFCNKCNKDLRDCQESWIEHGRKIDEKCINKCRLVYGDKCAERCCCPGFECSNRHWMFYVIFPWVIPILFPGLLPIGIIALLHNWGSQ